MFQTNTKKEVSEDELDSFKDPEEASDEDEEDSKNDEENAEELDSTEGMSPFFNHGDKPYTLSLEEQALLLVPTE